MIGADKLWGAGLATAGEGMKIGIIDDGIDARHVFFDPSSFSYPSGFPKGLTSKTTPKVIVQRVFAPPLAELRATRGRRSTRRRTARSTPPTSPGSPRATTTPRTARSSSRASRRTRSLGNYKALTIPTPGFGLDGNSAQIAAAIEAAVADGMNVINLSLGEPEISPERDFVVARDRRRRAAGVVPGDRGRQPVRPVRLRLDQLAGQRAVGDHGRGDDARAARSPTSPRAARRRSRCS